MLAMVRNALADFVVFVVSSILITHCDVLNILFFDFIESHIFCSGALCRH
jgi:hypothetical protein